MSTELGDLLDFEVTDEGSDFVVYRGAVSSVFTIGPKVHGGTLQMMSAAAARDALYRLSDQAPPAGTSAIAVASDFLAAPDPAEVELAVRLAKRGRTVSLAQVQVRQGDRVMVDSSVTLGQPDDGDPYHSGDTVLEDLPPAPTPDGVAIDDSPLGEVMHLAPAMDLVLDPHWFPVLRGEQGAPQIRGWTRPKDRAAQPSTMTVDFPVLVCDVSPPVVMNLGLFGWAPTVQLTTYLRRVPHSGPDGTGWLRFAATTTEVGRGMFSEDHTVVDETGALVAQSRQLALIPSAR
ncbi:thioesterase family protein [Gordonia phosphorivorans]|uniref:Thioesterase family protein n=1 Tax=Gordonia phosphorivorans TaxID=1056982 RepID=A0ABV6HBQ2_9ACTN